MYKIFVVFNYETIIKGYYEDLEKAQAAYQLWKGKYERQGYTGKYWDPSLGLESDPNAWVKVDGDEIRTNEEWVYTVSRIPFVGRTGDPGTGEMSYTPTGMTDTIEIHLELRSKASINPMGIKMNDNWTKARAMSVMTPPKNGDSFPGDFITVFYGSGGRFNYKLAGVSAGEYIYESIIACDAPQFLYRVESNSLDNFVVYDKPDHNSYQAVIYRPIIPAGEISSFKPTPTPTYCTVSASTAHGTVTGSGRYAKGDTCVLTWSPGGEPYEFVRWSNGVTTNPYSFVVTTDISLTAEVEYAPERYTLTFNATNGSCSPSTFTGTTGDTVTVTVTPTAGNIFKQWNDGNMQNPRIFTVGTQSEIYTATCDVAVMRTITMTSIANCSVTVNDTPYTGPVQVAESTRCTINCIPAEGYKFTKWQGDVIGNYTPFTFTVAAKNYTISPVVDHITYTLSFELNAFLTFTGAGTYNAGTSVQIEAIPNAHARFEKWWDDSDENPRTIVVNSNMRLSAVGHAIDYNLVVIAAPLNGLLSGTVTGGGSYVYDTMAPLTFTPIDGKTNFASWSDGGAINHSHRVTADETVTAYATGIVQTHYETATHGSITIHPSSSWVYGDNAIVEFVPEQHYQFSAWQDGNTENPRTIQVQGPVQLHCDGAPNLYTIAGSCNYGVVQGSVDGETWLNLPQQVPYGTQYQVRCVPTQFHQFLNWSDSSTENPRAFLVDEDVTFTAVASDELYPNTVLITPSSSDAYYIYQNIWVTTAVADCQYSTDGINWYPVDVGSVQTQFTGSVKLKGNNPTGFQRSSIRVERVNSASDLLVTLSGKVTSLLDNGLGELIDLSGINNALTVAFSAGNNSNSAIGTISEGFLNFTAMKANCCESMFATCKNLITATSTLPIMTLATECYKNMFVGCSSLVTAPALPATTLANYCYESMFGACTSLQSTPDLSHATTLAQGCFKSMFEGCTALTSTTTLPAMTLANECYYSMFRDCRALTAAPVLPATKAAELCYSGMYAWCWALTTPPVMALTNAQLPHGKNCCQYMFENCNKLTETPHILIDPMPGSSYCCTSMFVGCEKLNKVYCKTSTHGSNTTQNWLYGVAATGTFYALPTASWTSGSPHGIPSGWTRAVYPEEETEE